MSRLRRGLVFAVFGVAIALGGVAMRRTTLVSYVVQAATSQDGFLYSRCAGRQDDQRQTVTYWLGPVAPPRTVLIDAYVLDAACGRPALFNGGWIDVYEVNSSGDHYIGQVGANLARKVFTYDLDAGVAFIKLIAYPDGMKHCTFGGFEGSPYDPAIQGWPTTIMVVGGGELPLAHFDCYTPNPPPVFPGGGQPPLPGIPPDPNSPPDPNGPPPFPWW